MARHKVAELFGTNLRRAVAMAEGLHVSRGEGGSYWFVTLENGLPCSFGPNGYRPDYDWSIGGPILEREAICIAGRFASYSLSSLYEGVMREDRPIFTGPTVLIAAMRAFVASKLGPEVELP